MCSLPLYSSRMILQDVCLLTHLGVAQTYIVQQGQGSSFHGSDDRAVQPYFLTNQFDITVDLAMECEYVRAHLSGLLRTCRHRRVRGARKATRRLQKSARRHTKSLPNVHACFARTCWVLDMWHAHRSCIHAQRLDFLGCRRSSVHPAPVCHYCCCFYASQQVLPRFSPLPGLSSMSALAPEVQNFPRVEVRDLESASCKAAVLQNTSKETHGLDYVVGRQKKKRYIHRLHRRQRPSLSFFRINRAQAATAPLARHTTPITSGFFLAHSHITNDRRTVVGTSRTQTTRR